MGGDCTGSACENRFRRIKQDAKAINAALKKGLDPATLKIGEADGSGQSATKPRGRYSTVPSSRLPSCCFYFLISCHCSSS